MNMQLTSGIVNAINVNMIFFYSFNYMFISIKTHMKYKLFEFIVIYLDKKIHQNNIYSKNILHTNYFYSFTYEQ